MQYETFHPHFYQHSMSRPTSEKQIEAYDGWAEPQEQENEERDSPFAEEDEDTEETEESILKMMFPNKEEDEEYPYDDKD